MKYTIKHKIIYGFTYYELKNPEGKTCGIGYFEIVLGMFKLLTGGYKSLSK